MKLAFRVQTIFYHAFKVGFLGGNLKKSKWEPLSRNTVLMGTINIVKTEQMEVGVLTISEMAAKMYNRALFYCFLELERT